MSIGEANGYVLNVAPARREVLLDAHESDPIVAESVPEFVHSRSHPLVCFVSFDDGTITHLALGRRGNRAGTRLRRLNLKELTELDIPVSHAAVLEKIPDRFQSHVAQRFASGGLLPSGSFSAVVDAVRDLLPASNALLDRFSAKRQRLIAGLGGEVRRALAYQKETVATALALAGLDLTQLQDWQPRAASGTVRSFLDGLPEARLREDQMILNDLHSFPGFEVVRTMQHGAAVFSNDRVALTVVMANRHALENQIGADLIYRNETFGSFVIVQYKAMDDEYGGARFRLPNEQLTKELERMEELAARLRDCEQDSALGGFRLGHNPLFLKLCPRIIFNPDDASLIKGMYIPLEYWRRLEVDPCIEGPYDGRAVDFNNVGRYLNNTSFADLVANGWIGTTGVQTALLDPIIRQIVESGRTVTIAVKRDLTSEEKSAIAEAREQATDDPDLEEGFDIPT